MKDGKSTEKESDSRESFLAIDLVGKNKNIWEARRPRFIVRLINKIRSLWNSQVPGRSTLHEESKFALTNLVASAQEVIKSPQMKNMERQAEIVKKLSEANLNNSNAKKIDAETELIQVLNSQKIVESLIKKGELYPEVKDGKLNIIFKPKDE